MMAVMLRVLLSENTSAEIFTRIGFDAAAASNKSPAAQRHRRQVYQHVLDFVVRGKHLFYFIAFFLV